ncbi:MAG TPA: hypothetical protein VM100_11035 [Longimicrobiales bacterium]|nr:hypothetical protein [Longimicrobiales bacterium]
MIRTRSISTLSLAMVLVACSESSVEPRYAKQFDTRCDVTLDRICDVAPTLTTFPKSLSFTGAPQVIVLVVNKAVFPSGIPNGAKVTVGGAAPSDTVPGPLPPGPGQQLLNTAAGYGQFAAALHSLYNLGVASQSDTVPSAPLPGPPAPLRYLGSVGTQLSNGNYLVYLNSADLQKRGIISPESPALTLNIVKGNKVLYSGVASFGIISPEVGD